MTLRKRKVKPGRATPALASARVATAADERMHAAAKAAEDVFKDEAALQSFITWFNVQCALQREENDILRTQENTKARREILHSVATAGADFLAQIGRLRKNFRLVMGVAIAKGSIGFGWVPTVQHFLGIIEKRCSQERGKRGRPRTPTSVVEFAIKIAKRMQQAGAKPTHRGQLLALVTYAMERAGASARPSVVVKAALAKLREK
jgi:hypothetical protein